MGNSGVRKVYMKLRPFLVRVELYMKVSFILMQPEVMDCPIRLADDDIFPDIVILNLIAELDALEKLIIVAEGRLQRQYNTG